MNRFICDAMSERIACNSKIKIYRKVSLLVRQRVKLEKRKFIPRGIVAFNLKSVVVENEKRRSYSRRRASAKSRSGIKDSGSVWIIVLLSIVVGEKGKGEIV